MKIKDEEEREKKSCQWVGPVVPSSPNTSNSMMDTEPDVANTSKRVMNTEPNVFIN